jgi:hypothetical protein
MGPDSTRTDPVAILLRQATTRQPDLVPLRHTRMLASPFAFYRGGAAIMAEDLAQTPTTGIEVQCLRRRPPRQLRRLRVTRAQNGVRHQRLRRDAARARGSGTSSVSPPVLVIAARDREFGHAVARHLVAAAMRQYREAMREFATMRNLDVWYARLDLDGILRRWGSVVSKPGLAPCSAASTGPEPRTTSGDWPS